MVLKQFKMEDQFFFSTESSFPNTTIGPWPQLQKDRKIPVNINAKLHNFFSQIV